MKYLVCAILFLSHQFAWADSEWSIDKEKILSASAKGDPDAVGIHSLLIFTENVLGTLENGYDLAKKSASASSPYGNYALARYYETGLGIERDEDKAASLYQKAFVELKVRSEKLDSYGQLFLGGCYSDGKGVQKDPVEGVKWTRKGADQGFAPAQFKLGILYENGEGVQKDPAEAMKWYRKAADQGLPRCQSQLGNRYWKGNGVEKDSKEALKWWRKAAEQGCASAQYDLGQVYQSGVVGVQKDPAEAVKWYRKAADWGKAAAQRRLGECYLSGNGVQEDKKEAFLWLGKAAEQGDKWASDKIREIDPEGYLIIKKEKFAQMSKAVVKRTVDNYDGKSGGPSTEDILIAVGAHAFDEGEVIVKRGDILVSRGGQIPSGTRLYPIRVSGRIKTRDGLGLAMTVTYRFWKDEFSDWKFEEVNN
jgi:TPR repeat protein